MIVAEVLRQTSVPDTEEIGDHESVDQGNQSSFGIHQVSMVYHMAQKFDGGKF